METNLAILMSIADTYCIYILRIFKATFGTECKSLHSFTITPIRDPFQEQLIWYIQM